MPNIQVEIIPPDITPEENQRRIDECARVMSNILGRKVTLRIRQEDEITKDDEGNGTKKIL